MAKQLEPEVPEVHDRDAEAKLSRNVDEFVTSPWPSDVVENLANWKQGDLLKGSPRFWAAPASRDAIIGTEPGDLDWSLVADNEPEGWVVICSQTCDIAGVGPGARAPFIQVAPVFRFASTTERNTLDMVRKWSIKYLAPLTAPPDDGAWAVDLRLIMPASKGMLLGKTPRHGFSNQLDSLLFSEALGLRFRRPAVHDQISYDLPNSLNDYIKTTRRSDPEWWHKVEQVRLLVTGDRLRPTDIRLIVLSDIPLTAAEKQVWRGWMKTCKKIVRSIDVDVRPIHFDTLDKMPARLYKDSIPVRLPELGHPPSW